MHDQGRLPGGLGAHLCHMWDPLVSNGVLMEASQSKAEKKEKWFNSPEGEIKRVGKRAAVKRKLPVFLNMDAAPSRGN